MTLYLGIDIGGTKIAGATVNAEGQVIQRAQVPTPVRAGGPAILNAALEVARSLAQGQGQPVAAVGIGAGGQIDAARGVVVSATDILPGWEGTDVKTAFERALGVPACVDNDVNALAVGEAHFGAARDVSVVVFLALGTGVGGALLLNGRLHRGAHHSGAEFGQIVLNSAGGVKETLEDCASGPALARAWRREAGSAAKPCSGEEVAALAAQDPEGPSGRAVRCVGTALGWGLVSLAAVLDPDMFIVGGGMAQIGEALLGPARAVLRENALPGPAQCPVVAAALGAEASVVGAASLAMLSC